MTIEHRLIWTSLSIALAVAAAGCKKDPPAQASAATPAPSAPGAGSAAAAPTLPRLTDAMPSSVSSSRPPAVTGPDPAADYHHASEAVAAGAAATGRTILIRGYVAQILGPTSARVMECQPTGDHRTIEVRYSEAHRDFIRALPSNSVGIPAGGCPRILVRLTGLVPAFNYPEGDVVSVMDVQPDPPPTALPSGVDFVAMDDMFLAGPGAVGKVADFAVALGRVDTEGGVNRHELYTSGCSPHGGWNAKVVITENDANRAALQGLPRNTTMSCRRVRVRITGAPTRALYNRWEAELLGVGDDVTLTRRPNP